MQSALSQRRVRLLSLRVTEVRHNSVLATPCYCPSGTSVCVCNSTSNGSNDTPSHARYVLALPADSVLWATGAAPPPLLTRLPLQKDARGFICVTRELSSVSHRRVFATGDCCSLADAPWVTKAGVFAVRMAPTLAENLSRVAYGRTDKHTWVAAR